MTINLRAVKILQARIKNVPILIVVAISGARAKVRRYSLNTPACHRAVHTELYQEVDRKQR